MKLFLVGWILGMFFLSGCTEDIHPVLQRAEVMMAQQPKEAYLILKDSVNPQQLNEADYATWCLLITEATGKHLKYYSSDSLILQAVGYFEKHGPLERKVKARFYQGVVWDKEHPMEAMKAYLKAYNDVEKIDDPALEGRIYYRLGRLFDWHNLHQEALIFQKKAYDCMWKEKDTIGVGYMVRDMARSFCELNQLDSALYYYQKGLEVANEELTYSISKEMGQVYLVQKEYEEAYRYLKLSYRLAKDVRMQYPVAAILGEYFYEQNELDSARYYTEFCMTSPAVLIREDATQRLEKIALKEGDVQAALTLKKHNALLKDSLEQTIQTEEVSKMYRNQLQEQMKELLAQSNRKMHHYLYGGIGLLLLLTVGIIFFLRKKEVHIQHLQKEIHRKRITLADIHVLIERENERLTPDSWQQIYAFLEESEGGFVSKLRTLYPKITETELKVCCLIRCKYSVSSIATLLCLSRNSITMARQRLFKKIHNEEGKAKDLDMFILNL